MPRFNDVVIAPGFSGTVSNGFGIVFYVSNLTNPTVDQGSPGPGKPGQSPKGPFTTIQAAVNEAVSGRGDVIVIQRGTYAENVTITKAGLTLLGAVSYGYPDHVVIQGQTLVRGSGVSFYNIEFFSNSTSLVSLKIGDGTTEAAGTWVENCSFASDGTTEPLGGALVVGGNNHTFIGNRFIDNTNGLVVHSGITSFASGITVKGNMFLENTTVDFGTNAVADASYAGGANTGIGNLICVDNIFGAGAVTPTAFMNIVGTSTGLVAGNYFASATHASATIILPSGLTRGSNLTLAGWSIAVPA